MTTEPIPSLAEAMAEIRRLRARVVKLEAMLTQAELLIAITRDYAAEARLEAVEAASALALARGTLAKPAEDEPPFHVEHNVPPSAPPHNE